MKRRVVRRRALSCTWVAIWLSLTAARSRCSPWMRSCQGEFYALGQGSASGVWQVAVALVFARLFAGQSKPVVFSDSSATRGVCRRVRCGRQNHVQVRFLWPQEVRTPHLTRCIFSLIHTHMRGSSRVFVVRASCVILMCLF